MKASFTLHFDGDSGRYVLAGRDLHCGDCFQILRDGRWIDVRIEHDSNGWYLVGNEGGMIAGTEARFYD